MIYKRVTSTTVSMWLMILLFSPFSLIVNALLLFFFVSYSVSCQFSLWVEIFLVCVFLFVSAAAVPFNVGKIFDIVVSNDLDRLNEGAFLVEEGLEELRKGGGLASSESCSAWGKSYLARRTDWAATYSRRRYSAPILQHGQPHQSHAVLSESY